MQPLVSNSAINGFNIADAISELLIEQDCVVLPGFGAFVGQFREGSIDVTSGLFSPPSKNITFNRSLNRNDGLLAGYIYRKHGGKYADALAIVEIQVNEWIEMLSRNKPVFIRGVGKIQANADEKWIFNQLTDKNLLKSSYGLQTIHFDILQKRTEPVKPVRIQKQSPVLKRNKRKLNAGTRLLVTSGSLIIGIIGLTALLFLTKSPISFQEAGLLHVYSPSYELKLNHEAISDYKAFPTVLEVSDSLREKNYNRIKTTKAASEQSTPTAVKTSISSPELNEKGFYIIRGCFKDKSNADKMEESLLSAGKKVKVSLRGSLYQVGYYAGQSSLEAEKALKEEQSVHSEAWISRL